MTIEPAWRRPVIATALAIGTVLVIFARDAADMARLWWDMSTYQHCLFVLPIIGWLIWLRRGELASITPSGWPWGSMLVLGAGIVWLLGEAGGVALARHVGLVAMVQAIIVAVLGPAVARAMLFPLFYLVFLVPFGDEFTAPMQTLTAKMTMTLLDLTGVAATVDGIFITTRAGWFEVAEACAGVKFLVAMVAYGALAANLCFRSWLRRALFMTAAVVVPILANGVRAWGTIFVAERTSIEYATGFDHIVYGWVFFAVVMILIMAAAWPFFDRKVGDPWLAGRVFAPWRPVAPVLLVAPLAVGAAALPVIWDATVAPVGRVALPHSIELPRVTGWGRVTDAAAVPWVPRFDRADHRLLGHYGDAAGRRVDVGIGLYGWQGQGREIVGFGQGAANPDGPWQWAANLPPRAGGKVERLVGPYKASGVAVTFRRVGGQPTDGTAAIKLATMRARLTGGDQSAAVLIVAAQGADADTAIAAFLAKLGDPQTAMAAMLRDARGGN